MTRKEFWAHHADLCERHPDMIFIASIREGYGRIWCDGQLHRMTPIKED